MFMYFYRPASQLVVACSLLCPPLSVECLLNPFGVYAAASAAAAAPAAAAALLLLLVMVVAQRPQRDGPAPRRWGGWRGWRGRTGDLPPRGDRVRSTNNARTVVGQPPASRLAPSFSTVLGPSRFPCIITYTHPVQTSYRRDP